MRIYEINYIISGSSSEDELSKIGEKISGFISENSGKIEKRSEPARKSLGFRMSGQKDIFFTSIIFSMPSENIVEFEKKVKAESSISRYNLLKRDKVESSSMREFPIRRRRLIETSSLESTLSEASEDQKKETSKPKKVELKEIDQKIEEILSE